MNLTQTQRDVLRKMEFGKAYTAYDLQCSLSTLRSLDKRDIVTERQGLGALFSPRTAITFQLTQYGKDVKASIP